LKSARCDIHQFRLNITSPGEFLRYTRDLGASKSATIILFNADRMAGRGHVVSALYHAFRAFERGEAISNTVEMEALLYAAGSRQCEVGMEFGLHPGVNRVYLCICPGSDPVLRDLEQKGVYCNEDDWEQFSAEKQCLLKEIFGITDKELAVVGISRLQDLVIERVALLEVYR